MTYLSHVPKSVPAGKIVVHNHVRPPRGGPRAGLKNAVHGGVSTMRLGSRGFRAWLADPSPDTYAVEVCPCDWAPHLGVHYRVADRRKA